MKNNTKFKLKKQVHLLNKPLKFEFKSLFISLTKSAVDAYNAKWDDAAKDTLDSLSAMGLQDTCEERGWLLITRSLTNAIFALSTEHTDIFNEFSANKSDIEDFCKKISDSLDSFEIELDEDFFANPASLNFIIPFTEALKSWLIDLNIPDYKAHSIKSRFPVYFVHSLHQEWISNHENYKCLQTQINSPFTKANTQLSEWERYCSALQLDVEHGMFHEAFSLKDMFIWPRAYTKTHTDEEDDTRKNKSKHIRKAFWLKEELSIWLRKKESKDAIRIISGGPGSGKSSFARMYAAELVSNREINTIMIPLHRLKVKDDFENAIDEFIEKHAKLSINPLKIDNIQPTLLIFDGLDELAMQGKVGAETAISFIRHVKEKINEHNNGHKTAKLLALIGGREIVIQAIMDDYRKEGQIIYLLPYTIEKNEFQEYTSDKLLSLDQRVEWWNRFQKFNGQEIIGLPTALNESKLRDVTSQPLLNYLVALSYQRGKIDFTQEQNLNAVYADLLEGVYERGYEQKHKSIEGISKKQFEQTLEDISLAVWHSDGRKASIEQIEKKCNPAVLKSFADGAQKGIVKLLTAFYFRHSGDAFDQTFEFTHKSFGEYLIAKRLVRSIKLMHDEMARHEEEYGTGWDETIALSNWYSWTGPAQIDQYIFDFIVNELLLTDFQKALEWQQSLTKLLSHAIQNDFPLSSLSEEGRSYKKIVSTVRNSKESLLAILNACAQKTKKQSSIMCKKHEFGDFLHSIRMQRMGGKNVLALNCLSYLNLESLVLYHQDFYSSNLANSSFISAQLSYSFFLHANLQNANFENTNLYYCNFGEANLQNANLSLTTLDHANFERANLKNVNLYNASLKNANLKNANLEGADLEGADLEGANFEGANLASTNLKNAKADTTYFKNTNFDLSYGKMIKNEEK